MSRSQQPCDDEPRRDYFPTLTETVWAFETATSAKVVVAEIAKTGHASADTLISLCSALNELEIHLVGANCITERTDEFQNMLKLQKAHPELLTYSDYCLEYSSETDHTGTVRKVTRAEGSQD